MRSPDARDLIAKKTSRKYCKSGRHNFYFGTGLGGKSFSATLDIPRFCHQGVRVSEVSISTDQRLYGIYRFYMRFDHVSVQRGHDNWRRHGNYSGYFVRAKFDVLYCYEPTRDACAKTYILYLRNSVHDDGTSSSYRTLVG